MSINSLANAAAARRPDVGEPNTVPATLSEIASAGSTAPDEAPPKKDEAGDVGTALHVLFGYIPTEIVTLYVAVSAALVPTQDGPTEASLGAALQPQWIAFVLFLVATPAVVWVIFATKLKTSGRALPIPSRTWPLWEMSAATISYCTWAYALPGTPFRYFPNAYSPAMGSIAVLFASTALGLVAPLFQRPLSDGAVPKVLSPPARDGTDTATPTGSDGATDDVPPPNVAGTAGRSTAP